MEVITDVDYSNLQHSNLQTPQQSGTAQVFQEQAHTRSKGSWETCDFSGVHVYRSSNLLLIRHLPHLNKNIPESKNAGEACSVSRGKPENLLSYW